MDFNLPSVIRSRLNFLCHAAKQLREAGPFGQGPRFLIRDNGNKADTPCPPGLV